MSISNNLHQSLVVLVFLLMFTCFFPLQAFGETPKNDDVIYVDDDAVPPYHGTIEHPYKKIREGIDASSDGDTVFVFNGIYNEALIEYSHVRVDKKINVVGEDKHNTIINGTGVQRVIRIVSDKVNISGFTIQNGGNPNKSHFGMGIEVQRNIENVRIYDNIIKQNMIGLEVGFGGYSSYIFIYENEISENYIGFEFSAVNSEIYRNIITKNEQGLIIGDEGCSVYNNIISDNSIGVELWDKLHIISNNQISDNDIGLRICNTQRSEISFNNFIDNDLHTQVFRYLPIILSPLSSVYRLKWRNNYWDNWKMFPKPIIGIEIICIHLLFGGGVVEIPIAIFPYIQFDWRPAKEPHDIDQL
jgi:nitrous oxidase accessory protein NosD